SLFRSLRGRRVDAALGGGLVALATEFAVLAPVRPFARVGEAIADDVEQVRILRHAAEVPGPAAVKFVVGLVVALRGVVLVECFAARRPADYEVVARLE